jgi:hypothetical protein
MKKSSLEAFTKACLAMPKAKQAEWANGKRITGRASFRIDNTEFREFALWQLAGDQIGGHLRYNDAKRLADPRFERSKAHRGSAHNWYYVKPAHADWPKLGALITESYQAATQRGGGTVISATKLYAPLERGLAIAGGPRPPRLHASGPAAKVLANEGPCAFKLALWSAGLIRARVPKPEKAALDKGFVALDKVDALRDKLVATLPDREIRMGPGYDQLSKAAEKMPELAGTSEPIIAVRAAIDAFQCLPGGYNERAIAYCGAAVEATVRALLADAKAVTAYLVELDRRVLVEEVRATAKSRSLELPPVTRVLWRGADDKGFPALWLVELADNQLGLVCKLGRRWQLTTGTRDHVLATLPDTHFAAAVDWISAA